MDDYFFELDIPSPETGHEKKTVLAERFLDFYPEATARDMYRWLWEGEFGYGPKGPPEGLDALMDDIRIARIHQARSTEVWEEIGLSEHFIKINLVPYADTGCPLLRLLQLTERVKDIKNDTLRFKQAWAFMKTQVSPGMSITLESIHNFENEIPFHMAPDISYTEIFQKVFGMKYRIVPREQFFLAFPEFEEISEEYIS